MQPVDTLKWKLAERQVHETVKYWYRIVCLDTQDPVKQCYEWLYTCEMLKCGVETGAVHT